MKRLCVALIGLAAVSGAAISGAAMAADMSRPPPAPYYPPAQVAAVYNWTGFYFGINGGGAFGTSNWDRTGSFDISGGEIGGTGGYNWQFGQVVAGVEGDFDWADINGTTTTNCAGGCKTSDGWLATVRGRFGYAADRWMPFITAGGAFGNITAQAPGLASASSDRTGWTIGAGLEGAISRNWSAKVEYLYVDLGNFNCGLNCGAGLVNDNVSFRTNILRGGVNYHF